MSREDGILGAAFGIVVTFLVLIAVLATLGSSATAAAWVQAIGSVAAIIAAVVIVWVQNRSALAAERRAANERARIVRVCIAAEIEVLLAGIGPLLDWKKNDLGAPVALSTLGALNVRVYQAIIPQVGALQSELAAEVVSLYANLELLIQRGQEMERDLSKRAPPPTLDTDAQNWLGSLQRVAERMSTTLAELRAPD